MEARELRIGNLVKIPRKKNGEYYDKIVSLNAISTGTFSINEDGKHLIAVEREIEPIPLTEEILLKAGFEKRQDTMWTIYNKSWISLYKMMGGKYYEVEDTYTSLKYVHSLQNLYFALTGEELEIDLC